MEQQSIFMSKTSEPLASRLRPNTLDEYVGQKHLLGEGKILRNLIESDRIPSLIFWGPPGVGKTTLARIIATMTKQTFITFSAVTSGIKEIKEVMSEAEKNREFGERTIVFIDEIHRFNKAQQDAFLPFVEKGSIVLIGATTENPSFEINNALLSRCKVFVLETLKKVDIVELLKRALKSDAGFGSENVIIGEDIISAIAEIANGDARSALSALEMVVLNGEYYKDKIVVTREILEQCTGKKTILYDKDGEEHYNLISALHKSMRNTDADASIYWLARMLEAGEDPLYIARRIVRFASEDIGLSDPRALEMAISAYQACHFLGMPECNVALTEAVVYMALAPKSNSLYVAYNKASEDANRMINEPVPLHLRNASSKLMKELDYGKGYQYAHDIEDKITTMECLPNNLIGRKYYEPTGEGIESRYKERLENIEKRKKDKRAREK